MSLYAYQLDKLSRTENIGKKGGICSGIAPKIWQAEVRGCKNYSHMIVVAV
ncbi:hypothetical protein C2W64_03738 [Brevibacillus laterosporus]|nr:hypothetical protein C2W64_03738 [Brevibacillus laterosporus]